VRVPINMSKYDPLWEYIKTKSINDYKILENIRYYCLDITDNECDRRNCIEKIIF